MSLLARVARAAPASLAGGAALLAVMVFLLFMSSRTGQAEFDEAKRRLDAVEAFNMRVDAAVFPLLLGYQTDFDQLTQLQRESRGVVARFEAFRGTRESSELAQVIERKASLIDDFKSNVAVLRNSRAIGREMIDELWNEPLVRDLGVERQLFVVDRAFLAYTTRSDEPANERALRAAIADLDRAAPELAKLRAWPIFEKHAAKLIEYSIAAGEIIRSIYFLPIAHVIMQRGQELQTQLEAAEKRASHSRTALFAVAVLLLLFGATRAAQVRGYLRQIEASNRELDERVRRRTLELSEANESLRLEIEERERIESQLRIAHKLESLGQLTAGVAHEINTPTQYVSDNVAFVAAAWRDISPLLEPHDGQNRDLGASALETNCGGVHGPVDEERRPIAARHGSIAAVHAPVAAVHAPVAALHRPIEGEPAPASGALRANLAYLRKEVPTALEQALYGLQQIAGIVAAMRNFSHPGGTALEAADLNKAIESTALVARNEWKNYAELTLDLDDSLPLVPCDVSAVNQAVLNLIVNAAQAIADARTGGDLGRITIATRRRGEHVEITVEDDGPGIASEIEDRIFDPFFTTKDVGFGTGQGLAIAHGIIAGRHGGSLTHEAGPGGRGARFVIRLRLEAPTASAAGQAPAEPAWAAASGGR
jgi:signal transduction histidine kinase